MTEPEAPELRGARWEPEAQTDSFRKPLPWGPVGVVVVLVVSAIAYGLVSKARETEGLRAQLVREHAARALGPAEPVLAFRDRVERLAVEAARQAHPDFAAPGFRVDSLRGKEGVYLRLRAREAASEETVATALESMQPDVIPHCLSITPTAMRALYVRTAPLGDAWIEARRAATDSIRLEVALDEVTRFAERDLPVLQSIAASEYAIITIIRGEDRATDEVDFFVYDIRSGRMQLGVNTKANGRLLTTRVAGYGAPSPQIAALARSGAIDCSIAAQARTRTGEFGGVAVSAGSDAGAAPGTGTGADAGVPAEQTAGSGGASPTP